MSGQVETKEAKMAKAGEWIEHDGKGMPVDGDVLVHVKFAVGGSDEDCEPQTAMWWNHEENWIDHQDPFSITHYRIVKENDNG